MSTSKVKRRWGLKNSAYDILANPATSTFLNDEQHAQVTAQFVYREKNNLFDERFTNLLKKQRFIKSFNSSSTRIEDFGTKEIFGTTLPAERIAAIYKNTFEVRRADLIEFCRCRRQYENHILKGNHDDADRVLENHKNLYGESIWYVRCKFATLINKGEFDELEQFSKACQDRSTSDLIRLIFRYSLLLESNPTLHFDRIVTRTIRTLDEANLSDWAGVLRLLFCPAPLTYLPEQLFGLKSLQVFPLVDQFCLLEKLIHQGIAINGPNWNQFDLSSAINTPNLLASSAEPSASTNAIIEITQLYEKGEYENAITKFKNSFDILEERFTPINIVAKAIASTPNIEIPFHKGALESIIHSLVRIYKLDASTTTLEEDFKALAIKYHHLRGTHSLQLSIFKALPQKYDINKIKWAARAATAGSSGTPLSLALANGSDPILEYDYISTKDSLTSERLVKSQIRSAWASQSLDKIPPLLVAYKTEATLAKDFVEVASTYYLKTSNHTELLKFAAVTLAENPRMFIALPMEEMITHLESTRNATLEAIVIFYAYAKYVDRQKEYLLHEAFEEYLLCNEADRPTALLIRNSEELSLLQQVFFRDISTLETMDYLGCFNNSNELRSERVQLLDELRNRNLISPEAHREEVDEIIGQVVVDAGAAEFNSNKIEVNTSALKRNLLADVNSMLQLYKSLNTEEPSNKKTISVGDGSNDQDSEKLQALIAGDKNTALLRLLVLIYDAFLSDEKLGLDKNLSTEIRHGFFANLMRSRLEEQKLITEIDEHGNYKSNQHWREVNTILNEETLDQIDLHLAKFSKGMNDLIEKAEEWMKVSRTPNPDRVFVFEIYVDQLHAYHAIAAAYDAEGFIDVCFSTLWNHTEARLTEIREKLNVTFKDAVNNLFDTLLEEIEVTRMNFPMTDLVSAIVQVKSGIREDITAASEWFKRSETGTTVARTVEDLVRISLECFYRVRGVHLNCTIIIPSIMQRIRVAGQHSKAFIVVFVNLLENAVRGSGVGMTTPISVSGIDDGSSWSLRIKNSISHEKSLVYTEEYLKTLDSTMRSPFSIPLMRREGGSGLTKVFNQLRLIDDHFDVRLNFTREPTETFEVGIFYEV